MICMRIGSHLVQISGSTALLTGASGGLGEAIARGLHARGARLVLSGRDAERLAALAQALDARVVVADLALREDVHRLAREAGEPDIVIANAALPGAARLEALSERELDRVLDVNLRAPIVMTHALLGDMLARRRGHFVYVSSIGAKAAAPGNPLYHASKFGLRGFAAAMRVDLHGSGVSASCVMPGFIRDAGLYAESGASLPPGVGTRSPQDVADAVARAIERDVAEIEVSPLSLRLGALLSSAAPDLAAALGRRLGSEQIANAYERSMRAKR
jgi:short-subunit dehydrogenase